MFDDEFKTIPSAFLNNFVYGTTVEILNTHLKYCHPSCDEDEDEDEKKKLYIIT